MRELSSPFLPSHHQKKLAVPPEDYLWSLVCFNPSFFPGEFHGQKSLAGCNPWGLRVGHNWVTNTFTLVKYNCWVHPCLIFFLKICYLAWSYSRKKLESGHLPPKSDHSTPSLANSQIKFWRSTSQYIAPPSTPTLAICPSLPIPSDKIFLVLREDCHRTSSWRFHFNTFSLMLSIHYSVVAATASNPHSMPSKFQGTSTSL